MKQFAFTWVTIPCLLIYSLTSGQQAVVRKTELCECPVKIDSSFHTRCAYLIVPENRKKKNGKMIKLPFIVVESKNPDKKKDPLLFTGGGPGGSSLGWARGAARWSGINSRDCIAFEQRGTRYAVPQLWSTELDEAIRESYRKNLNKDSMTIEGVKRYKKALEAKGIDLSGYNTDETVADIHDLLVTLAIDSVNLSGISYSGGLMLAVLQKDPSKIRSLILDSPLPTFVPIDEDEPANFNEALEILFQQVDKDSVNKDLYGNLKNRFRQYFSSIEDKVFTISYVEKGSALTIQYTRRELMDVLVNAFYESIRNVPYMITEMIRGNHNTYIKGFLDRIFGQGSAPSGMRISVYCADQAAYNNTDVMRQLYSVYPYMQGYHINDVYKAMCDCWKVSPVAPQTKRPFYSDKPALLADGRFDNACRPLYIDRIHHYMPNSQRVLFMHRGHGVGGKIWNELMEQFLANPFRKLTTGEESVMIY